MVIVVPLDGGRLAPIDLDVVPALDVGRVVVVVERSVLGIDVRIWKAEFEMMSEIEW